MSTDNQQTITIDEQTSRDAAKLRAACDTIDAVAETNGGNVDSVLRDVEHVIETVADVLDEENGAITREELQERVYPRGGQR